LSKILRVWGRKSAFNVQKVLWLIDELQLDHEHIDVGGQFGGLDTPEFLNMNPHGKVPVIDDDGIIVWESHAIIRYLCCKHSMGQFWAEGPGERSLADRWMDWSQSWLQRDFMELFWSYYRMPEEKRDWPMIQARIDACASDYLLLDRHLANQPYLAGDTFTMADIPAGTTLYRYFKLEIERPHVPNVQAWYSRLQARPAFVQHVMRPFDELRAREDF